MQTDKESTLNTPLVTATRVNDGSGDAEGPTPPVIAFPLDDDEESHTITASDRNGLIDRSAYNLPFLPSPGQAMPTIAKTNFYGTLLFLFANLVGTTIGEERVNQNTRAFAVPAVTFVLGALITCFNKHFLFVYDNNRYCPKRIEPRVQLALSDELEARNTASFGTMTLTFTTVYVLSELNRLPFPANGFLSNLWELIHLPLAAGAGLAIGETVHSYRWQEADELPSASATLIPALLLMMLFIGCNNMPFSPNAYEAGLFDLIAPLFTLLVSYTMALCVKLHHGNDNLPFELDVPYEFNQAKRLPLAGAFLTLCTTQAASSQFGNSTPPTAWQHGGYLAAPIVGAGLGLFARKIETLCEERSEQRGRAHTASTSGL